MKRFIILAIIIIVGVAFFGRALVYSSGLQVTSWFRTPWHNKDIGGTTFSLHQIGWAYDVVPQNTPLQRILEIWPFKCVVESDHIHLQIL